jgi:hypothetical protein
MESTGSRWMNCNRANNGIRGLFPSLNMTAQRRRRSTTSSPADCNHLAVWPVIISEIMFPRLSIDDIEKKLFELFVTRARPQRFHDVKLEIAAKTWAQLPIAGQPQLVAVLAKMQVGHRTDETYALPSPRNLIVSGRAICSKFRLWNQTPVSRFD